MANSASQAPRAFHYKCGKITQTLFKFVLLFWKTSGPAIRVSLSCFPGIPSVHSGGLKNKSTHISHLYHSYKQCPCFVCTCMSALDIPKASSCRSNVCAMMTETVTISASLCHTLTLAFGNKSSSSGSPSYSTGIQTQSKRPGGVLMACHSVSARPWAPKKSSYSFSQHTTTPL